ncbi:mucin-associated surface protein (MASP) [Trypanosoma cruzi]|nr:mucin-associated surface protein (MASP) [Trypanosoma cruzi]
MAMMMTCRVLLVCALCVLWCGVGGVCTEEEETAGRGSGADLPLESKEIVISPEGPQGLQGGAPGGEENLTPVVIQEADDDDDDEETKAEKEKSNEMQSVQEVAIAPGPDSREKNLSGSDQEMHQAIISAEDISPSSSQESKTNPTQTEFEKKTTDENTPAAGNALTTVNGEQTLPAEGNLPSPPEDSVDSRKQDGEDTTSEDKKMFRRLRPRPHHKATETKAQKGLGKIQKQRQ